MPVSVTELESRLKRVGSFEVVREVGQGGMGVVYLARQPTLERYVVLKRIRRELLADPGMVERFQREARAAAAVQHQNVVAVYDCFAHRGDHYIAQEYVDGPDLRTVLDATGPLAPRTAALIGLEIARGLEEIHARGIVHRDLKPGNILLGRGGESKIADFGIALEGRGYSLTRPGTLMGSVPYLSPEQLMGERVDYRSDLFLLGILLYEMLTGSPPFEESEDHSTDTLLERMLQARYEPLRRRVKGVPRSLQRLVRRCLRAKPVQRIASATDARRVLERLLGRISPADARREIAAALGARGAVDVSNGETGLQPAVLNERFAGWRGLLTQRTAPAALLICLIGIGAAASAVGLLGPASRDDDRVGVTPPPDSVGSVGAASTDMSPGLESFGVDRTVRVPNFVPATVNSTEVDSAALAPLTGTSPPFRADGADAPRLEMQIAATARAAAAIEPAQVTFVVWPWAEVRIDGEARFLTPRAAPLSLAPGNYDVVLVHPSFGEQHIELELVAGEARTVRHRFAEALLP